MTLEFDLFSDFSHFQAVWKEFSILKISWTC